MSQKFLLSNGIATTLRRYRKAKRLSLRIKEGGDVSLSLPFFVSFREGKKFLESRAEWILEKANLLKRREPHFLRQGSREEYVLYKEQARRCIMERLEYFQSRYPFRYKRVAIRHSTTRWGSCSAQGNLNFSYRLLFLPEHLRDYVIVHELCHLKELNHSRQFWTLVESILPEYRAWKQELEAFARGKGRES